ncbi:hypothetical protein D3C78_1868330 [compost metagenome]
MQRVTAFFLTATNQLPRAIETCVQLFLVALGADATAHVIRGRSVLQTEVRFDALQYVVAEIFSHGFFTALRLRGRAPIKCF